MNTDSFKLHDLKLTFFLEFLSTLPNVKGNFGRPQPPSFSIARQELVLQLNTAPLVPEVVEKPAVNIINSKNNVTGKNDTNSNETRITHKNVVSEDIGEIAMLSYSNYNIVC